MLNNLAHIQSLLLRSVAVQAQIELEQRRGQPDIFRLLKLKKTQLIIKEHLKRAWAGEERLALIRA